MFVSSPGGVENLSKLAYRIVFAVATRDLSPGQYLCNDRIVSSLRERGVEFELPKESNFRDIVPSLELSEESFKASLQVSTYDDTRSFSGYHRGKERGTGTRNYGIIVGLTSRTASFARLLADRARDMKSPNFDGVVPISHTELGRDMKANNVELVLRTLAGFIVHSNVAFSVLFDDGDGAEARGRGA